MKKTKHNWLLWILLIFFPPLGIIYMWISKKQFSVKKKIILSIISVIWFFFCVAIGQNKETNSTDTTQNTINESESNTDNINGDLKLLTLKNYL